MEWQIVSTWIRLLLQEQTALGVDTVCSGLSYLNLIVKMVSDPQNLSIIKS